MEENIKAENQLKLNYSLKGSLLVHKHALISGLIFLGICLYFVITTDGNEENIRFNFWIPFLAVSILSNCCNLYSVFSLTQNDKIHLFLACFPVQIVHCTLYIGWFCYVIAFCFTVFDVSSKPLLIFLVFIFSYCILDSFMIILLLTSILCKTKILTSFLCKYWFVREVLVFLMSCLLICFYSYLLGSGQASVLNILFLILFLTQAIILLVYMKLIYFKPKSWAPKPLEAKLPNKKMITDAFLIKASMDEDKIETAGAA